MVAGWPAALISESTKYEAQNATAAQNLDYKKPFHFLISWKRWTGTTVSCTVLPALGLMTGKNLKSPDCRLLSAKTRTFSDIWTQDQERNNSSSILEYDHSKSTMFCQCSFWLNPAHCLVYYSFTLASPSAWSFLSKSCAICKGWWLPENCSEAMRFP